MKKIYSLVLFVICFQLAKAVNEVPNPGFENWTTGNPDGWYADNIPSNASPITQYSPGHAGSYALKGQPVKLSTGDTLSPLLISGTAGIGFPITQRYSTLEFYYQTNLVGGDLLELIVSIYDASSTSIAIASDQITANATGWTKRTVTLSYSGSTAAASAIIEFVIGPSGTDGRSYPNLSSYFILDDVALTGLVGIDEVNAGSKLQVFPVPAHDKLSIKGQVDQTKPFHLVLTDASGRVVIERSSNTPKNAFIQDELNLQGIAPGFYSLTMITDEKSLVRRVIVE